MVAYWSWHSFITIEVKGQVITKELGMRHMTLLAFPNSCRSIDLLKFFKPMDTLKMLNFDVSVSLCKCSTCNFRECTHTHVKLISQSSTMYGIFGFFLSNTFSCFIGGYAFQEGNNNNERCYLTSKMIRKWRI